MSKIFKILLILRKILLVFPRLVCLLLGLTFGALSNALIHPTWLAATAKFVQFANRSTSAHPKTQHLITNVLMEISQMAFSISAVLAKIAIKLLILSK